MTLQENWNNVEESADNFRLGKIISWKN